jgi:hypothetical protein
MKLIFYLFRKKVRPRIVQDMLSLERRYAEVQTNIGLR